ncbi:hypothetical protein WN55_08297 [Dufourea novaeangliae]|uniref:Uncharacterized protein n=1 Tax=Dufourea novaeangliae TaxID=178035 RepID=A0A154P6F8_DUFNO|nr:hypothetical protein WN55_08297 [Dufourea novaeangliae]
MPVLFTLRLKRASGPPPLFGPDYVRTAARKKKKTQVGEKRGPTGRPWRSGPGPLYPVSSRLTSIQRECKSLGDRPFRIRAHGDSICARSVNEKTAVVSTPMKISSGCETDKEVKRHSRSTSGKRKRSWKSQILCIQREREDDHFRGGEGLVLEELWEIETLRRSKPQAFRKAVRFELAGFGEYGSFVVPPRGPAATAAAAADRLVSGQGGMKPKRRLLAYLPGPRSAERASRMRRQEDPSYRQRNGQRRGEAWAEEAEELRTNLLFVTRVCVNPVRPCLSAVCPYVRL